jgi:hypothetical protein
MQKPITKPGCLHQNIPQAKLKNTSSNIIYSLICPHCGYELTATVAKWEIKTGQASAWSCCDRDFLLAQWSVSYYLLSFETQLDLSRMWDELEDPIFDSLLQEKI